MTDGDPRRRGPGAASDGQGSSSRGDRARANGSLDADDLRGLARDWITLWQSELAALAVDREAQETWHALLSLWAGAATSMFAAAPRANPASPFGPMMSGFEPFAPQTRDHRSARPAAAARTPPADPPPDARDAEIERLGRRVVELEQRLAELERGRQRRTKS